MQTTLVSVLAAIALLPWAAQDPKPAPKPPVAGAIVPADEAKKWDPADLKKMEWLCGTWVIEQGGKTTEEHWRPLQGTTILGSSHSFDAAKTNFFEHLRITAMRGTIAYLAMPGGKPPTAFLLAKLEDGLMVFENPKHDAPQRITYQKTEAGITATVCQMDGSKAETFVFKKKG